MSKKHIKFKRIFIATLAVLFILSMSRTMTFGMESDPYGDPFDGNSLEESIAQEEALIASEILWESEGFDLVAEGPDVYPDDFAGVYIGEDDMLHVCYTGDSFDKYATIFLGNEAVVLEEVEYSYSELNALIDTVFNVKSIDHLVEGYVDIENNQAVIGASNRWNAFSSAVRINEAIISNDSLTSIEIHGSKGTIVDSLPIRVYETDPIVTTSELWAGDYISGNGYGYTLGVTGYYNGSPAIVTAGHNLNLNTQMNYNSTRIGLVQFQRFHNNMYGDYAIVPLSNTNHVISNKGFGPLNNTTNPIRVTGSVDKAINNARIYRYGQSSGWSTGVVEQTDVKVNVSGTLILGHTKATFSKNPLKGDSGGPVYVYQSGYKVCGIFSAANLGTNIGFYSPFTLVTDKGFVVKSS